MKLLINEERPIKRLRACDGTLDCDDVGRGEEEVNQQPFLGIVFATLVLRLQPSPNLIPH